MEVVSLLAMGRVERRQGLGIQAGISWMTTEG